MNHVKNLGLAKKASEFADYKHYNIGAVLVYRNQVISVGWNSNRTHPVQAEYNKYRNLRGNNFLPKIHAEIACLVKADRFNIDFGETFLYVYRELKTDGRWAMARPCPACMAMIKDLGIKTIIYTTKDGYSVEKIGDLHYDKA